MAGKEQAGEGQALLTSHLALKEIEISDQLKETEDIEFGEFHL
jgi:hypothetical protein